MAHADWECLLCGAHGRADTAPQAEAQVEAHIYGVHGLVPELTAVPVPNRPPRD